MAFLCPYKKERMVTGMAIKTLNGLKKKIEACVNKALREEVTDAIREEQQKKIDERVYDVYSPKRYERRDVNGGLIASETIEGEVNKGTLVVSNNAPPNPYGGANAPYRVNLVEVIETGAGAEYGNPGPRPFIQPTIDSLRASNKVEEALKVGLKKQGLKVK